MKMDLSKLDKKKNNTYLELVDMKGTSISLGYSRSGYFRFNIEGDRFPTYRHMDTNIHPCLSFDESNAKFLLELLIAYKNKKELYYDSLKDIYNTQLLLFRSNETLMFLPVFEGEHKIHWKDKYIKLKWKDVDLIIEKIKEMLR